jgi:hypothetical protein
LPKLNAAYQQFIEQGTVHERGFTVCASNQHILDIVNSSLTTGTWKEPCVYTQELADLVDYSSDDSTTSAVSAASSSSAAKKKTKKTPSVPSASPSPTPPSTGASPKLSKVVRRRYRVDPTLLKKFDLTLANDIGACYEHDESAHEDISDNDSSGRKLLKYLGSPLTDEDGHDDSTSLNHLQSVDRKGFSGPYLSEFNAFRTELKLANELVPTELKWTDQYIASRLEAAAKRLGGTTAMKVSVEITLAKANKDLIPHRT